MTTHKLLSCLVIVLLLCSSAVAERKTQYPKDAKLIVWGTVKEVVHEESNEYDRYRIKILVENKERGYIRVDGRITNAKEIWATCFSRKASAPLVPSASGHTGVPEEGQFIRALLMNQRDGAYEGIYPDWFHTLELTEEQLVALRWVQSIGPGCYLACNDDLPGSPVTKMYTFKMWKSGVGDEHMKYAAVFPDLRSLSLYYSQVRSAGFQQIAELEKLEELILGGIGGGIKDEDIEPLAGSKSLQKIDLMNSGVTDRAMLFFSTIPTLRSLNLVGTKVTDAGLGKIKGHPALESLSLNGQSFTDLGMTYLSQIKTLKRLQVSGAAISGEGLGALLNLRLEVLDLRGCRTDASGLKRLGDMSELRKLNLHNTKATDDVMKEVAKLAKLEELTIQGTAVTDKGFLLLKNCPKLRQVWFHGLNIRAEAVDELKAALPRCKLNNIMIE
ncbi:MAG: hypothetical protein AAF483_12900 [Planctomycetota bacterium]